MKYMWTYRLFTVAALSLMLVGCGGSGNPFDSVPVTGKVTYEDGSLIPVSGMKLYFHCLVPPKDGLHPRTAAVSVGSDGTFKDVTTHKYADGLVFGQHKVSIDCRENGTLTKKIPKQYATPTTTPLIIEVTESGQVLEIKVPKP